MSPGFAVVALAGLGLGVWVLHKVGRALASILEALAAAAVVFVALWWLCKAVVWMLAQVVTRWRTGLAVVAVYTWCQLDADGLPEVARTLLVWADTLDNVSAQLWRLREGRWVHLSITGWTPCGIPARVFGVVRFESSTFPISRLGEAGHARLPAARLVVTQGR